MNPQQRKRFKAGLAAAAAVMLVGTGLGLRAWWLDRRDRRDAYLASEAALDQYEAQGAAPALKSLEAALGSYDHAEALLLARAQIQMAEGRWEKAAADALGSLKAHPSKQAYRMLGRTFAKRARILDALQAYAEAVRLAKPADPVLLLERADLYLRAVQLDKAVEDSTNALDIGLEGSSRREALRLRARARVSTGDYKHGLQDLDAALREDAGDVMARLMRAQTRYQVADYSGTIEDAATVLAQDADNGPAYVLRAEALLAAGRRKAALKDLLRAEKLMPGHPRVRGLLEQARKS